MMCGGLEREVFETTHCNVTLEILDRSLLRQHVLEKLLVAAVELETHTRVL